MFELVCSYLPNYYFIKKTKIGPQTLDYSLDRVSLNSASSL